MLHLYIIGWLYASPVHSFLTAAFRKVEPSSVPQNFISETSTLVIQFSIRNWIEINLKL